ncbi:MAG: ribonuclease E inhibitor RraB [Chloroflexota bacterium]|nr:ribonuclease E inhibitor RraB [Chloroflexota bacterium]
MASFDSDAAEPPRGVYPSDPLEGIRLMLVGLQQKGADLTEPRLVRYYLHFPSQESALDAMRRLQAEGYVVEPKQDTHPRRSGILLVVSLTVALPTAEAAFEFLARLDTLASLHGGSCVGYEASQNPWEVGHDG